MDKMKFQPVDISKLEGSLETLLESYRDALKFVEYLPEFGNVAIKYHDEKNWLQEFIYPNRKWVNRWLVRLFVESHIRRQLNIIMKYLRIETASSIKDFDSNEKNKHLESYINQLEKFKESLKSWNLSDAILVRFPWFPGIIAIATPVLAALTGMDLSSTDAAIRSIIEFFQSSGSFHTLVLLVVLFLEIFMLISPLTMHFGFQVKRAIFSGGNLMDGLFDEPKKIIWIDFPVKNIYKAENRVFEILSVAKSNEFPLDFYFNIFPFNLFIITSWISVLAINHLKNGGSWFTLEVFISIFCWAAIIILYRTGRHNLAERRKNGNM